MISLHVFPAQSLRQKVIGLIGAKKPYPLLLETRFGIHTFGVRFPLDIVILDQTNTIVCMKKTLLPNRIFLWNPIWKLVVELPQGTISEKNLHIGQKVSLRRSN